MERKMKMCSKVCNCQKGATHIWKITAYMLRCHYLENFNSLQFALLFPEFNCMVSATVRQNCNRMLFPFGNASRMNNLRKESFRFLWKPSLTLPSLFLWTWMEIKDADMLPSRSACLGRRPNSVVSTLTFSSTRLIEDVTGKYQVRFAKCCQCC